jgi:two-component system, chemotaxis family, protein-glutamate methylesterase/glutaminase
MKKIKVCIVDDSALVRQVITGVVQSDSSLELIFTAVDPVFATEKMKSNWPDVIILDVEMPRMDGISFLKKIMQEKPTPVIICSTLTEKNSPTFYRALENGAVEIITKPTMGIKDFMNEISDSFLKSIHSAANSDMKKLKANLNELGERVEIKKDKIQRNDIETTDKLIAIGTSTGGTIALESILTKLEINSPGILIVQHMPEKFTESFAKRLNTVCKIEVKEAAHGERILNGMAYIAPGNKHMQVKRQGAQYFIDISDGPLVSRHRPSVDVLFRSVAKNVGQNAVGIIMTGMGDDGASGLKEIKDSNGFTVAQSEESCVVFGMPKEAIKKNAVNKILHLNEIPALIHKYRV